MEEKKKKKLVELVNGDRLQKIRKQLEENKDEFGNELDTIEIMLDNDVEEFIEKFSLENNVTLNEIIWLALEEIVKNEKQDN